MGLDGTEPTLDCSDDSKSRSKRLLKPLASEDSLGNSHSDRHLSDHEDDENWMGFKAAFDQIQKRNSGTIHSMASTATLTSTESSHGNNSFSNSNRSPTPDRRGSIGNHKSPRRSPRAGIMSSVERQIAQLPLSTANGQALEDDRGKVRSARRSSRERKPISKDGPPKVGPIRDGKGSYYQPSKASLHDSKLNQPPKKPQRIRSRSKGPALRRKSQGDQKSSSAHGERTTGNITSSGTSKRSKSCEPQSSATPTHGRSKSADRASPTKTKKKISPTAGSRITRKKPSSAKAEKPSSLKTAETQVSMSSTDFHDFHESWPRPIHKQNKDIERQKQRQMIERAKEAEKFKPGEKIRRKKPSSSKAKKKETKEDKEDAKDKIKDFNDINEVITFFEEMAAQKHESPPERGLPKKSNSARNVRRSQSPASSSLGLGTSSTHGAPSDVGDIASDILDPSNKRRQRRSSAPAAAPAKALAAFHQYKKSIASTDGDESPGQAPPEKILLDVSELAALEIIRLGKDNSLKLDLFDLMKHLKKEQLRKNKG